MREETRETCCDTKMEFSLMCADVLPTAVLFFLFLIWALIWHRPLVLLPFPHCESHQSCSTEQLLVLTMETLTFRQGNVGRLKWYDRRRMERQISLYISRRLTRCSEIGETLEKAKSKIPSACLRLIV